MVSGVSRLAEADLLGCEVIVNTAPGDEVTTYSAVVAFSPAPVAVTTAVPGVAPFTVTTNCPLLLVLPESGERVTEPEPEEAKLTVVFASGLPEASLRVAVTVELVPSTTRLVAAEVTLIVAPLITTGICWLTEPTEAVIVAVRLLGSAEPAVKVTVAAPSVPAVTDPADKAPESALKVMTALAIAA